MICGMGAIASIFDIVSLHIRNIPLACISFCFTGAGLAILPIGIDFAVELTFPVAESISTGLQMSLGNLLGLIMTLVLGVVIGQYQMTGAWIAMSILSFTACLSLVLSCTIKEDLRRQREERDKGVPYGLIKSGVFTDPNNQSQASQSTQALDRGGTNGTTSRGWPGEGNQGFYSSERR